MADCKAHCIRCVTCVRRTNELSSAGRNMCACTQDLLSLLSPPLCTLGQRVVVVCEVRTRVAAGDGMPLCAQLRPHSCHHTKEPANVQSALERVRGRSGRGFEFARRVPCAAGASASVRHASGVAARTERGREE